MTANDILGGQFDREPNRRTIPTHHRDAILNAISHMGERGMELVPGGIHVTPSDGGKSHFIPHHDTQLFVNTENPKMYEVASRVPSEGHHVGHSIANGPYAGLQSATHLSPLHIGLKTTVRESFDDPAHLMDRTHDAVLPTSASRWGPRTLTSWGGVDDPARTYMSSSGSRDSEEVLNQLPHLGGNPKEPAQELYANLGHESGMTSEDIDATKGLHHAWSHAYDAVNIPRTSPSPSLLSVARSGPIRSRERHAIEVHVADGDNLAFYKYDTTTGQIRPNYR